MEILNFIYRNRFVFFTCFSAVSFIYAQQSNTLINNVFPQVQMSISEQYTFTNAYENLDSSKWKTKLFRDQPFDAGVTPNDVGSFLRIYQEISSLWGVYLRKKHGMIYLNTDSLLLISTLHYDNFKIVPMGLIALEYTSFAPHALDSGYILFQNGKYMENSSDTTKMYKKQTLFLSVPLMSEISAVNKIVFDPVFSVVSDTSVYRNIKVHNGNTSSDIFSPVSIPANSTSITTTWKLSKNDSLIQTSMINFQFFNPTNALSSGEYSLEIKASQPCFNISIPTIISFISFPFNITITQEWACPTAKMTIYYGCNNNQIKKPFVFVEGFDPGLPQHFEKISPTSTLETVGNRYNYGCLNWKVFKSGTGISSCRCVDLDLKPCKRCSDFDSTDIDKDNYEDYTNLVKAPKLIDKLHNEGFDVIYVEFKYSTFSLDFNTKVLKEVLKYIKQNKSGNHKIILAGGSMGGIITRMALQEMESNNEIHQVRDWITFDSPHYGANIPLSVQFAIDFFATNHPINNTSTESNTAIETRNVLNSDAAKNMLFLHYTSLSQNFVSPINFTPPQNTRVNIAIANGSNFKKQGQGFGPGVKMLELNTCCTSKKENAPVKGKGYGELYSLLCCGNSGIVGHYEKQACIFNNPLVASKTHTIKNLGSGIDDAPGGFRRTIRSLASQGGIIYHENHCFVPTISALAINPFFITTSATVSSISGFYFDTRNNIFLNPVYNYIPHPNIAYIKQRNIVSSFDVLYAPDDNEQHVEITDDNINFIMNEISPNDLYLQNESYPLNNLASDADQFEARNSITAGKNVTLKRGVGDFVIHPGANITFRAGDKITLKDGFSAKAGSTFRAYIEPFSCSPSQRLSNSSNYPNNEIYLYSNDIPVIGTKSNPDSKEYIPSKKFLHIFPNPSSSFVHIHMNHFSQESRLRFTVTNLFGQVLSVPVQKSSSSSWMLDFSGVPEGVYVVRLHTEDGRVYHEKVVVRR
jgi:hypothetical protein